MFPLSMFENNHALLSMFLDSFVKIFAHLDYRSLIDNTTNFSILKSMVPARVVCYASEIAGLGVSLVHLVEI
jgi:hypothetical protein